MPAATPPPAPAKPAAAPAEAAPRPRRKGAIDTLIARDQTAVFWFLVACLVAALCAWYIVIMSEALAARPPFVVMDSAGSYYVTPGWNFNTRMPDKQGRMEFLPMHTHLNRIAVETLFERGPEGLDHADRVNLLFSKNGAFMLNEIVRKENDAFRSQQIVQTVTLDPSTEERPNPGPITNGLLPEAAGFLTTGTVTRKIIFQGKSQQESFRFKVAFFWKINPDMRRYRAFPAVIEKIPLYSLEKFSDS